MLGTTQVFPVPTPAERRGLDTTAFPGDTLVVPINPQIAAILASPDPAQTAHALIQAALAGGGDDNISAIVVKTSRL